MSESINQIKENSYICFNSLITLNLISDNNQNTKSSKYMMRMENSDTLLSFKLCKKPFFEYSDLTESLFFIRDIEECKSIYDNKEVNKQNNEMSSKEIRFIKRDKLNQSTQFILQHMISGKYISTEMKFNNNKIILKLVNDFESAYLFSFRKINETRSSVELLTYSHIFYLNVYINEEKQFYFVNEESSTDETDINKLYYDIVLSKRPVAQFCIINQTWVINQPNSLYSGQLINIIFSQNINGKEEKFMLGVEEKKCNYKEEEKNVQEKKHNKYKVVPYLYTDELCEHVLKKTFWFLEGKAISNKDEFNRDPIQIKEEFRIKNAYTGLYLFIKKKKYYKK